MSEQISKAELARQERIKTDAAFVADQLSRHRAIYLISMDGSEIAAHLGVASLVMGSANAIDLRKMEETINGGEAFILCSAHDAVGFTDRVEPSVRERLWTVDLRGEFQTLYCTTDGDDPAPSRHFGEGAYHWGTMPKTIAKVFPKRAASEPLAGGWRVNPYATTLRTLIPSSARIGYLDAVRQRIQDAGGRVAIRVTVADIIVEASLPSERAAAMIAEVNVVEWTEVQHATDGPITVTLMAPAPKWVNSSTVLYQRCA